MKGSFHESLIQQQFGQQAEAYLHSRVHAQGEDLRILAQSVGLQPQAELLDLGCGGGHVSYQMAERVGQVVAFDLSPSMLAVVAKSAQEKQLENITTVQGNVAEFPFDDDRFDFVVSRYSAHHWQMWEQALREVRRVLKPGGKAIFIDVAGSDIPLQDSWLQTIELLRDPSHVKDYSAAHWLGGLARAGFQLRFSQSFPLFLDFQQWIARMTPPPVHVEAIHSLLASADPSVQKFLGFDEAGNFTLTTVMLVVE